MSIFDNAEKAGDNVGAGFIPALTPQKIYKHVARMMG